MVGWELRSGWLGASRWLDGSFEIIAKQLRRGRTGADATKATSYAKENLDIYGFSLTAAEMTTLNGIQDE